MFMYEQHFLDFGSSFVRSNEILEFFVLSFNHGLLSLFQPGLQLLFQQLKTQILDALFLASPTGMSVCLTGARKCCLIQEEG